MWLSHIDKTPPYLMTSVVQIWRRCSIKMQQARSHWPQLWWSWGWPQPYGEALYKCLYVGVHKRVVPEDSASGGNGGRYTAGAHRSTTGGKAGWDDPQEGTQWSPPLHERSGESFGNILGLYLFLFSVCFFSASISKCCLPLLWPYSLNKVFYGIQINELIPRCVYIPCLYIHKWHNHILIFLSIYAHFDICYYMKLAVYQNHDIYRNKFTGCFRGCIFWASG